MKCVHTVTLCKFQYFNLIVINDSLYLLFKHFYSRLYPSEDQYTQSARSAVYKWPHLEKHYESIRSRLNSQFIDYRRKQKDHPIIKAKKLKFTPKSKRKRNDENTDPINDNTSIF
jgi:hypothetical protein